MTMEISQYSAQSLLGARDPNKDQRHGTRINDLTAIQPIRPIAGQAPQQTNNVGFDTLLGTVVDTVNPLQHLPGVSTAYQAVTDDTMNPIASMAGGFLFGGPMGLAAGAASSFIEMITGKSLSEHASAFFGGAEDAGEDGARHVKMADGTMHEPMMQQFASGGASLKDYTAFADAKTQLNLGVGTDTRDANLASNLWTMQTLKHATSAYETQQNANTAKNRVDRLG